MTADSSGTWQRSTRHGRSVSGYFFDELKDYVGFVKRMQKGAQDVVAAVKLNNADQARAGMGEITQACSECHELYR